MALPEITAPGELEEVRDLLGQDREALPDRKILRYLKKYDVLVDKVQTSPTTGQPETVQVPKYTSEQRVLLTAAILIERKHSEHDWDYNAVKDVKMGKAYAPSRIQELRKRAAMLQVAIF